MNGIFLGGNTNRHGGGGLEWRMDEGRYCAGRVSGNFGMLTGVVGVKVVEPREEDTLTTGW